MPRFQPDKEKTVAVAIRVPVDIHEWMEDVIDITKLFSGLPELITFAVKNYYLDMLKNGVMYTPATQWDEETISNIRSDVTEKRLKFDMGLMEVETIQVTVRFRESFLDELRVIAAVLRVSLQDFIKAAAITELYRLENYKAIKVTSRKRLDKSHL